MILTRHLVLTVLTIGILATLTASGEVFLDAPDSTDTGHFTLSWGVTEDDGSVHFFVVEQAREADFSDARILYEGDATASSMSGLLDGVYHYRARLSDSDIWSDPIAVVVQHHSLTQAFIFLGMGAVVFLATGVLIIAGHIKQRRATGSKEMT